MGLGFIAGDFKAAQFSGIPRRPVIGIVFALVANPGFRALAIYRLQQTFENLKPKMLAKLLTFLTSSINHFLTGAEFVPGCHIGPECVIRHPTGIVIGSQVVIGKNSTLQHGVTIGVKYVSQSETKSQSYPKLGNNITVGTNAVIIGDIQVGDFCTIGANSVLTKNLEPGKTFVK